MSKKKCPQGPSNHGDLSIYNLNIFLVFSRIFMTYIIHFSDFQTDISHWQSPNPKFVDLPFVKCLSKLSEKHSLLLR